MSKRSVLPLSGSILGALFAALAAGCGGGDGDSGGNAGNGPVGQGAATVNDSLGTVDFAGGDSLDLTLGFTSAATHRFSDPANVVYGLTDRGPNVKCKDSGDVIGVPDFCMDAGTVDDDGKIFPLPNFTPQITRFSLSEDDGGGLTARIEDTIVLRDADGDPISGISNPLVVTDTENGYDADGDKLTLDPEGLDPEGLVRLADGSFWLTEEYGPSLVHVAADGKIVNRVVPTNEVNDLGAANYPVSGGLPVIVSKRKLNRGIESLALSPDGTTLFFALQSPLANPDKAAYKTSRNIRLFTAALDADGAFDGLTHEYVYRLDTPDTFFDPATGNGDENGAQSDVKVSEMSMLPAGGLILLERIAATTKLYRVELDAATDVLGGPFDDTATRPSLTQTSDLPAAGITPVVKHLVFNSLTDAPDLPEKIEGVAVLDDSNVLLANDNDFGITDEQSTLVVLPIAAQLAQ